MSSFFCIFFLFWVMTIFFRKTTKPGDQNQPTAHDEEYLEHVLFMAERFARENEFDRSTIISDREMDCSLNILSTFAIQFREF